MSSADLFKPYPYISHNKPITHESWLLFPPVFFSHA